MERKVRKIREERKTNRMEGKEKIVKDIQENFTYLYIHSFILIFFLLLLSIYLSILQYWIGKYINLSETKGI